MAAMAALQSSFTSISLSSNSFLGQRFSSPSLLGPLVRLLMQDLFLMTSSLWLNLIKVFGEHDMDGMPENSQPEQKKGHEDDLAIGGGKKRWHWWPGGSVFRMLVPVQKVASIVGRKGEYKCVKRQELALRFLMVLQELQKEL
ncbi:hypothetical protein ACSBR2_026648 [Camellia fascicularis]